MMRDVNERNKLIGQLLSDITNKIDEAKNSFENEMENIEKNEELSKSEKEKKIYINEIKYLAKNEVMRDIYSSIENESKRVFLSIDDIIVMFIKTVDKELGALRKQLSLDFSNVVRAIEKLDKKLGRK